MAGAHPYENKFSDRYSNNKGTLSLFVNCDHGKRRPRNLRPRNHRDLPDSSRSPAFIRAEEEQQGGKLLYWIGVKYLEGEEIGESENGFFDALRVVRGKLEKKRTLLHCFGASEDVYPSPMQEEGPAAYAYRTRLGRHALTRDLVCIFDTDETVRPSTVEEQRIFHDTWLRSLLSR